jgi:hypothetical protein
LICRPGDTGQEIHDGFQDGRHFKQTSSPCYLTQSDDFGVKAYVFGVKEVNKMVK